jgi:hypothetical protein
VKRGGRGDEVQRVSLNEVNNFNTIFMESDRGPEEKVPLFKKWSYWYWLVAGFLLLCIGVFYFLTKHFS